jgi:hypothetical protein
VGFPGIKRLKGRLKNDGRSRPRSNFQPRHLKSAQAANRFDGTSNRTHDRWAKSRSKNLGQYSNKGRMDRINGSVQPSAPVLRCTRWPMLVSVLITSRDEPFPNQTVSDVLFNAKADIEIIIVLDGFWTDL